jgi:hypothetical protein
MTILPQSPPPTVYRVISAVILSLGLLGIVFLRHNKLFWMIYLLIGMIASFRWYFRASANSNDPPHTALKL